MTNYRIIMPDELNHHGVKGMKWGVRKDPGYSSARTQYKQARREYSKAYSRAYGFSSAHPVTQWVKKSKNYNKSNKLWGDANAKAKAVQDAKSKMKMAKKIAKQQKINSPEYNARKARVKKAAIIGGSVVAAGLAIYGGKKLHDKKILALANAMAERGYGKGPNYFSSYKEARSNWYRGGLQGYKDMIRDVAPYRRPSGYLSPRELKKMNIEIIDNKQNDYLNRMADSYYRKKHTYTL